LLSLHLQGAAAKMRKKTKIFIFAKTIQNSILDKLL
jgi:hypothetical protein